MAKSGEHGSSDAAPLRAVELLAQSLSLTEQLIAAGRTDEDAGGAQLEVLQALRALRNACAGSPAACEQLLQLGLVTLLRNVLDLVSTSVLSLNWQVPLVAAQALANAANTSDAVAAAAWAGLFPGRLTALAHICTEPLQSAVSLGLLACCKRVPGAAEALAGPAGAPLLTALLCNQERLHAEDGYNDTLGLLLAHLCFKMDLLEPLFSNLGRGEDEAQGPADLKPTVAHVTLLQELSGEVQSSHWPAAAGVAAEPSRRAGASMRCLVEVIARVARAGRSGSLDEGQQQLLQDGLQLLRDITCLDDDGRGIAGASLVEEAAAAGVVPLLLSMLKALPPINIPNRPEGQAAGAANGGNISSLAAGISVAQLAPALLEEAAALPCQSPYRGYRTDVLSVLANLSYRRPGVKAEVLAVGGVELVLSQCQMDREAPLAREWALWAIRNLCEGNEAAQMAIQELQVCATVESPEMRQLGVRLEVDEASGKMRVVQRQPPEPHAEAS